MVRQPSLKREQTFSPLKLNRPIQWTTGLWYLLSLPLVLFLALPLVALLMQTSPTSLAVNLGQAPVIEAVSLSLSTTLITVGLTILFGTPVAYVLARRQFPLRSVIDTLIDLPIVLPPAVAGITLLMAFGRQGIVGNLLASWGVHIAFTQVAVVMAQTFVAAPFFVKAASVGFAAIETELEQAAALDGANNWQIFRYITLPLTRPALISGSVMTWARALGEFGATIIFAGNYPGRTQTMPLAIYLGFELNLNIALVLSVILVGCSFLVLVLLKRFLRQPTVPIQEGD